MFVSNIESEVRCTVCHTSHCWKCISLHHPNKTCLAAREAVNQWQRFLMSFSGATSSSSDASLQNEVAGMLSKLEAQAADNKFFKENILNGIMKRCPNTKCKRLIQKVHTIFIFDNILLI